MKISTRWNVGAGVAGVALVAGVVLLLAGPAALGGLLVALGASAGLVCMDRSNKAAHQEWLAQVAYRVCEGR